MSVHLRCLPQSTDAGADVHAQHGQNAQNCGVFHARPTVTLALVIIGELLAWLTAVRFQPSVRHADNDAPEQHGDPQKKGHGDECLGDPDGRG
jgi:hypothetical protein